MGDRPRRAEAKPLRRSGEKPIQLGHSEPAFGPASRVGGLPAGWNDPPGPGRASLAGAASAPADQACAGRAPERQFGAKSRQLAALARPWTASYTTSPKGHYR